MKKTLCVIGMACVIGFTACGKAEGIGGSTGDSTDYTNSITINKDGSVENTIIEDFSKDYYDVDELKAMIETSVADYMQQEINSHVELTSCKKSDENTIAVKMKYSDYKAYAGFNEENFFVGTIKDAYQNGYELEGTLKSVNENDNSMITKQDLLNMGESHIVIWEMPDVNEKLQEIKAVEVNCYDDILYVGKGVNISGKKTAEITLADDVAVFVFE